MRNASAIRTSCIHGVLRAASMHHATAKGHASGSIELSRNLRLRRQWYRVALSSVEIDAAERRGMLRHAICRHVHHERGTVAGGMAARTAPMRSRLRLTE